MIRVAHLVPHVDRAHREPSALLEAWPTLPAVASAAARAGARVTVLLPFDRDAREGADGVEYRFVREVPGFRRGAPGTRPVRRRARGLARALSDEAPDVVHVHGIDLPGHARWLRRRVPHPVVLGQDHGSAPPTGWRRGWERFRPAPWDAVAFTARAQATPFVEAGILSDATPVVEVLEASTSIAAGARESRSHARSRTGLHGTPCLVALARLAPVKDPFTVLEGVARAAQNLPDVHLWWAFRDAPLLDGVRRRVREDARLRGRVHLLGERSRDEVEALLRSADLLVQGSLREGSGYAVIEAMACGVPPVVTDIPALRRIVGEDGQLWPPGEPAALASALEAAAGAGPDRRAAVRARFDEALSWDAVGRELLHAYEVTLSTRSSRSTTKGGARP